MPSAGKTAVFNAVTGGCAELHSYASKAESDPNLGVVTVPDDRHEWLVELYKPKKSTLATIELVDVAGMLPGMGGGESLSPKLIAYLRQVDALVHVVRAFTDPSVAHASGSVDPARDAEMLELELILADLCQVERKLEKMDLEIARKKGSERAALEKEQDVLAKMKTSLASEKPLRCLELTEEDSKAVRGYMFLSQKPLLIVANIDESEIGSQESASSLLALKRFAGERDIPVITFCATSEMEIAQLPEGERGEYLEALGITEASRDKLVRTAYKLLDLVSFFTVGGDEVKTWTIGSGTVARDAAGKVHTDIARGFIRAEVVSFADLKQCGSWPAARDKGLVRLEGKDYLVKDGDCINFRFAI